jgi:hypothetical protein
LEAVIDWWPVIGAFAHVAGALAVTVDAVLRKRESIARIQRRLG